MAPRLLHRARHQRELGGVPGGGRAGRSRLVLYRNLGGGRFADQRGFVFNPVRISVRSSFQRLRRSSTVATTTHADAPGFHGRRRIASQPARNSSARP